MDWSGPVIEASSSQRAQPGGNLSSRTNDAGNRANYWNIVFQELKILSSIPNNLSIYGYAALSKIIVMIIVIRHCRGHLGLETKKKYLSLVSLSSFASLNLYYNATKLTNDIHFYVVEENALHNWLVIDCNNLRKYYWKIIRITCIANT